MSRGADRGILTWATIVGLAGLVVWTRVNADSWIVWLQTYQSLVGGLLALGGAVLAYCGIEHQMRQADGHREDERRRDNNAARAVLPLALDGVGSYACRCIELLHPVWRDNEAKGLVRLPPLAIPDGPTDMIPAIRDCVRFAEDRKAEELAALMRQFQVQRARLSAVVPTRDETTLTAHAVADLVYDAVELRARAESLFTYGRGESEEQRQTLRGAASGCGIWHGYYPELDALLAEREERLATELERYSRSGVRKPLRSLDAFIEG